jgi:hypothetical protein
LVGLPPEKQFACRILFFLKNKVKPEAGEGARECCHSAEFLLLHAPKAHCGLLPLEGGRRRFPEALKKTSTLLPTGTE